MKEILNRLKELRLNIINADQFNNMLDYINNHWAGNIDVSWDHNCPECDKWMLCEDVINFEKFEQILRNGAIDVEVNDNIDHLEDCEFWVRYSVIDFTDVKEEFKKYIHHNFNQFEIKK